MSTSSPAIQVRIGPRISAVHLAIITTVFIAGLLTGLLVASGGLRLDVTSVSSGHRTFPERGPQDHIADMIRLRSQVLGHRFPVVSGH